MPPPVLIAGAGPVGLSLALGLARHGVRALVVEEDDELSEHSRAPALHTRTLEIFRAWGVLDDFLAAGDLRTRVALWVPGRERPAFELDLTPLTELSACGGMMILPQNRTERLLADAVADSGMVEVRFGHRLASFSAGAEGVVARVEPRGGAAYDVEAGFLVGCDGADSTVRRGLELPFPGKTYPSRLMLADVTFPDARGELPGPRLAPLRRGLLFALPLGEGLWRIVGSLGRQESEEEAVGEAGVGGRVEELFGAGPWRTVWASTFEIHCRTSPRFRAGRVLLAGDAAHVNSPAGGQGMNSGIQDAHNLAWKLGRVFAGGDAEVLLGSYDAERRPAVLTRTDRFTDLLTRFALLPVPLLRRAGAAVARAALGRRWTMRRIAPRIGMLDVRYSGSPLLAGGDGRVGARAPDGVLLRPGGGQVRVHDLCCPTSALLLFDDERLPRWAPAEVRRLLGVVDGVGVHRVLPAETEARLGADDLRDSDDSVWRRWGAEAGLVALVRPDGHVGWTAHRPRPEALVTAVGRALGARPG